MVRVTVSDLRSEFLLLPKGIGFIEYPDFQAAYQVLKRHTAAFSDLNEATIGRALRENSRAFGVLRAILGMTPPEWADFARTEVGREVGQGATRTLDRACRVDPAYIAEVERRLEERRARPVRPGKTPVLRPKSLDYLDALVAVAVRQITQGAPPDVQGVVHHLDKFDTAGGLDSVRYAASADVPYAVLLYERYLGRPFAGHRDAVSGLVGEVMESAIAERMRSAGITFRQTGHAERIPGFGQAPDFCIPDEVNPAVVIEAKITSDDGTARDKVARIRTLITQRDAHVGSRRPRYEVVACIDGRGSRERREDMRQLLLALSGKVFTTASLDQLIAHTRLREFVTNASSGV